MKKRLLSLLLVVALVFSLSGTALAAGFNDTVGHEAEAAIDRWTGHGVVSGDAGTGTFRPNGTLTRAEMAKIIANLVGLKKGADISMYGDVPENEWYAPYIAMCVAAGIMNGRDATTMDPTGEVTQQEFYTMLGRALALTPQANADTTFADGNEVADYASGYVNALADLGALSGDAMNNLNPTDPIPRGAVMMVMDKTIDDYVDTEGAEVTAGTGITLIVASDVTVTGQVENLIVGGDNAAVTLAAEATVKTATVVGPETALTVEGTATAVKVDQKAAGAAVEVAPAAQVQALTTAAPATSLAVSGQVGTVSMAETAQQATVTVQEQAKVDTLITAAPKAEVEVSGAVAAVQVANTAQQATVTVAETAKVDTLTAAAPETSVAVSGSVASVQVADTAEKANVTVNEAAKVDTLTTAAPETSVAVSGTVSSVEVADTAAKTEITTSSTAKVEKVDTKADNVAVTGDGKVDNVAVSGNDTAVQTGGTKVDVATGTTGTTAGDTEVKPGDTATTTPSGDSAETKPSTPSTPSTPSKPSTPDEDEDDEPAHSHRWSAWADNGNGTHSRECACGEVRTQNCAYASTYDKDASGHWYTCTVCGGATAVTAHTYDTTDCTKAATCTVCAYKKAAGTHTEVTVPGKAATCTATGLTDGKKCSSCGTVTVEQTVVPVADHTWVAADCTTPKTCSVCELTEGTALGHTWVAATCTAPKTCSVCNVTEGEKLDHTYGETNVCSCGAVNPDAVAKIGNDKAYTTLAAAFAAAEANDTVTLIDNVELVPSNGTSGQKNPQITVSKNVTLAMGAYSISYTDGDTTDASITGVPALFYVTSGTMTITGTGTNEINVKYGNNGSYGFIVDGGKLVIEDGIFNGAPTAIQVTTGALEIEDGQFFAAHPYETYSPTYLINCIDTNYKNGTATASITGGTFVDFNPADSESENPKANFCAPGYTAVADGDNWEVVKLTAENGGVAQVGTGSNAVIYASLAEAIAVGGNVTLVNDVDLEATILVERNVTLNLNGKTISNTEDLWDDKDTKVASEDDRWSLISVRNDASLTINGTGALRGKANDCYAIDLYNGDCTINGGTYVGNISTVYVREGELNITDGEFDLQQLSVYNDYRYLLNCVDNNYEDKTAKIVVTGGTFKNFNPADNAAEGADTNFCAQGYVAVESSDNVWTVREMTDDEAEAKIGNVRYATLAEAIEAAKSGDVIDVLEGENIALGNIAKSNITIQGAGKTKTVLKTDANSCKITGEDVTIKDVKIDGTVVSSSYSGVVNIEGDNVKLENVIVVGGGSGTWSATIAVHLDSANKMAYLKNCEISGAFRGVFLGSQKGGVEIDGCTITPGAYVINVDGGANGQKVVVKNSFLNGWLSYSATVDASFENCSMDSNGSYAFFRPYSATTLTNCDFATGYEIDTQYGAVTLVGCTLNEVVLNKDNAAALFGSEVIPTNNVIIKNSDGTVIWPEENTEASSENSEITE